MRGCSFRIAVLVFWYFGVYFRVFFDHSPHTPSIGLGSICPNTQPVHHVGVACAHQPGEPSAVYVGKMDAAVTQDDGKMQKSTNKPNFVPENNEDPASESGHDETQHDFVLDFVQKELGGDLKSLKNVAELLEKVRAEKEMLEEQVNSHRRTCCMRTTF